MRAPLETPALGAYIFNSFLCRIGFSHVIDKHAALCMKANGQTWREIGEALAAREGRAQVYQPRSVMNAISGSPKFQSRNMRDAARRKTSAAEILKLLRRQEAERAKWRKGIGQGCLNLILLPFIFLGILLILVWAETNPVGFEIGVGVLGVFLAMGVAGGLAAKKKARRTGKAS